MKNLMKVRGCARIKDKIIRHNYGDSWWVKLELDITTGTMNAEKVCTTSDPLLNSIDVKHEVIINGILKERKKKLRDGTIKKYHYIEIKDIKISEEEEQPW